MDGETRHCYATVFVPARLSPARLFPTNLLTSVAVGSYLAATGAQWVDALPFVFLTLFVLGAPALVLLAFGERAETFLPKARNWMETNSWVVNEVVIVFFIGLSLSNLLG